MNLCEFFILFYNFVSTLKFSLHIFHPRRGAIHWKNVFFRLTVEWLVECVALLTILKWMFYISTYISLEACLDILVANILLRKVLWSIVSQTVICTVRNVHDILLCHWLISKNVFVVSKGNISRGIIPVTHHWFLLQSSLQEEWDIDWREGPWVRKWAKPFLTASCFVSVAMGINIESCRAKVDWKYK